MRVLIVDDEKRTLDGIANVIRMYCPEVQEIITADSVSGASQKITSLKPDIILLDIQLKDGSGFDLIKIIQPLAIPVIFITAHEEFAVRAFNVAALHYMLKPIDPYELAATMKRAFVQVQKNQIEDRLSVLLEQKDSGKPEISRIVLKTVNSIYVVSVDNIVYCEADKNYTSFYLKDGARIVVSKTMGEYESLLPERFFLRIHQTYLLNMNYIARFDKAGGGKVVTSTGTELPVSTRKRDQLMKFLNEIK